MRFVGRGHPAIRATHAKTLEFTTETDISERATCVVAVGTDPAAAPMAGPVRITITAADESFGFAARANSGWDPSGTAVIRRSPLRRADTLATHAGAAAKDLPRPLAGALRDPRTTVTIDVEPVSGPACTVLFALDPHHPDAGRLHAELAAADLVVAEDEQAAYLVGERVAHGEIKVVGRVLVLATGELPGRTVTRALRTADIETVGLAPARAAAAASPSRGPLLVAADDADVRDVLRRTPAGTRLVLATSAERLPALVRLADEIRGPAGAVLVQPDTDPVRVEAGRLPQLAGKHPVHICFDATTAVTALDPVVARAVDGLLADGVATKTVAQALATLTGWERRRAYDAVIARRAE